MTVDQVPNAPHIPAWKRLGLKLKNSPSTNGESNSTALAEATFETKSKKRKAADSIGAPHSSHDQPDAASTRSEFKPADLKAGERQPKRKKSVTFVDGTKKEDGDINEKLLEEYVAQQRGGENQFSKAEIAKFTAPTKVHQANQPSIKAYSKPDTDAKEAKKKEKLRKKRVDASNDIQQDTAYIAYLKEYRSSRATWKFNKNHQTKLIQNLYNIYRIPIELDASLALYLSGLQGEATRQRLAKGAEDILSETKDLDGADDMMASQASQREAKEKSLKEYLKHKKSHGRNQEAAEEAYSDEHQEKLRRRKRAALVLQSLKGHPSPTSDDRQDGAAVDFLDDFNTERAGKRRKSRRSRRMRTGVPDDDDTDETSSVSSVPSSATGADEDDDSNDSESSSTVSSTSADESSSDESSTEGESESESETE